MHMHLHHSFMAGLAAFVTWLLFWIPTKAVAANFVGRNRVADVIFGIL